MSKKLSFKNFKWLVLIVLLVYLVLLVDVIILKNGTSVMIAKRKVSLGLQKPLSTRILYANFIPFKTILGYLSGRGYDGIKNILGNILAFVPLGFLLPALLDNCKKIKKTLVISILISASFEIIQLLFDLGSCDIDDIILNTLGVIIGFIIYKNIEKIKFKPIA